jgi:hypothetical protein
MSQKMFKIAGVFFGLGLAVAAGMNFQSEPAQTAGNRLSSQSKTRSMSALAELLAIPQAHADSCVPHLYGCQGTSAPCCNNGDSCVNDTTNGWGYVCE